MNVRATLSRHCPATLRAGSALVLALGLAHCEASDDDAMASAARAGTNAAGAGVAGREDPSSGTSGSSDGGSGHEVSGGSSSGSAGGAGELGSDAGGAGGEAGQGGAGGDRTPQSGGSAGDAGDSAGAPASVDDIPTLSGCNPDAYEDHTADDDPRVIAIARDGLVFTPKCMLIHAGQSVTFEGSLASHPLAPGYASDAAAGSPANPITETTSGSSAAFTFEAAGTYPYHCRLHGYGAGMGMSGAVHVR